MNNGTDFTYTWRIGPVTLHFTDMDLFDLPVDAVVNSEQTDFVLSTNPDTISGQLYRLLGDALQDELDRQTEGQTLPTGTVLKTTGGKRYRHVYHAGFHHPDNWLDTEDRETQETDSVQVIRRCIREILGELATGVVQSIGFPLIGTGVYNIAPSLLAYEFAREIVDHAQRGGSRSRDVWLAIRSRHAAEFIEPLVQGLVDGLYGMSSIAQLELGVGFLDQFSQRQMHAGDPRFRAWMLTRYTELFIEYVFFRLANASSPPVDVETTLPPGQGVSFGFLRLKSQNLAIRIEKSGNVDGWPTYLAKRVRNDMQTGHRVLRIVQDRNDLAHGRAARDPNEIEEDLVSLIDPIGWAAARKQFGDPGESNLSPWIHAVPMDATDGPGGTHFGVLDRWTQKHYEYLVPDTGQTFRLPRLGSNQ